VPVAETDFANRVGVFDSDWSTFGIGKRVDAVSPLVAGGDVAPTRQWRCCSAGRW